MAGLAEQEGLSVTRRLDGVAEALLRLANGSAFDKCGKILIFSIKIL